MQITKIGAEMNNILIKAKNRINNEILFKMDDVLDHKICGVSLSKYEQSVFRDDEKGIGMTGSHATHYIILKKIFDKVNIEESDSFIDVGCGKGRVLSYLIMHDYKCAINGVEINETSGKVVKEWTSKYPQIRLMVGDAFKLNYNDYTVLFLGRPFLPVTFLEFIELIESQLDHQIQLIYWVDQQSGHLLSNRKGWTLVWREIIDKIGGFKVVPGPQGCSLWRYNPQ